MKFVRYADDCVIAVKSEAAAKRVMHSIAAWIERRLDLKVNMTKTQITKPTKLKYLGYSFWHDQGIWRVRPHQDSVAKFKRELKKLTKRRWSVSLDERIIKLNYLIRGWIQYFAYGSMKTAIGKLEAWLYKRLKVIIWKAWKTPARRQWGLEKLGVSKDDARRTAYWGDRYQLVVTRSVLRKAIKKEHFTKYKKLLSPFDYYIKQRRS